MKPEKLFSLLSQIAESLLRLPRTLLAFCVSTWKWLSSKFLSYWQSTTLLVKEYRSKRDKQRSANDTENVQHGEHQYASALNSGEHSERQAESDERRANQQRPSPPRKPILVRTLRALGRKIPVKREDASIALSLLTLLAVVGQLLIYMNQSDTMTKTLEETHTANRRQLAIANRNARTAEGTLEEMKNGGIDTHTMAKDATKSLSIVQNQFRLDQRPRIRILEYELRDYPSQQKITAPQPNKVVMVNINYVNVGKTSAFDVIPHSHILFKSQISQFKIEPADSPDRPGAILDPSSGGDRGSNSITAFSMKEPYSREDVKIDLSQTKEWDGTEIYLVGRITYKDGYGTFYCLPYMEQRVSSGSWANITSLKIGTSPAYLLKALCPANSHQ